MAELTEVEEKGEIEKVEEEPKKRVYIPEICTYNNEDNTGYTIEVILPGVEKETVKLKMSNDYFFVHGETDTIEYSGIYQLCCSIDPKKAKSTYKNGLLKIEVPYVDLIENTINVEIE